MKIKKKKRLGKSICICSYKNTKADSMLSSAKKRIITVAHQHAAFEIISLLQADTVIRLSKWGYPAETQIVLTEYKHNTINRQAAISLPHKL